MTTFELFPVIFLVAGLLTAAYGVRAVLSRRRFERVAARADAQVTDVRSRWVARRHDSGRRRIWIPVVRFETADGRTVEAEVADALDWGGPEAGQHVEVFYDPGNPAYVRMEMGAGDVLKGGAYVAIGTVFAIVGLTMLV